MDKKKTIKCLSTLAGIAGTVAAVNHIVIKRAEKNVPLQELNENIEKHDYHWIFGDIHYTKTGKGRPILLVHNIHPASAGYEWQKVIPIIAGNRTVYTIDLMCCGLSKKSKLNYTNYFYTQLIRDFVKDVIGEKTDVATIGNSFAFVASACQKESDLFGKLIFIAPREPKYIIQPLCAKNYIMGLISRTPILGTLLYNIEFSRMMLKFKLENFDFEDKDSCTPEILDTCYYHAHLHGYSAKSLFSSFVGGYMNIDVSEILKNMDHKLLIIIGRNALSAKETITAYRRLNPRIDTKIINNTKDLIPLENHLAVANAILNYTSV